LTGWIITAGGVIEPLAYRLAGYVMATMMDDPAMLALAFC
jgi:hypothetical protein